jgi:hypothetical protein
MGGWIVGFGCTTVCHVEVVSKNNECEKEVQLCAIFFKDDVIISQSFTWHDEVF